MNDILKTLIHAGLLLLIVWGTSLFFPDIQFQSIPSVLIITAIIVIGNLLIKPIVKYAKLPVTLITTALVALAINGLILMVSAFFLKNFEANSFMAVITYLVVVSVLVVLTGIILGYIDEKQDKKKALEKNTPKEIKEVPQKEPVENKTGL